MNFIPPMLCSRLEQLERLTVAGSWDSKRSGCQSAFRGIPVHRGVPYRAERACKVRSAFKRYGADQTGRYSLDTTIVMSPFQEIRVSANARCPSL